MEDKHPHTIWIQRDGYAIELTEDEIRKAYAQCKEPANEYSPVTVGRASSQMTSDIFRLMDDIRYAVRRYDPTPRSPFEP